MSSPKKQNEFPDRDSVASDHVACNEETGTYRTEFGGHARRPTEAVVHAVAEATQTDPLDLSPLHSVLDTDALNVLVESNTSSQSQSQITVCFEYADHHVILKEHGTIVITPPSTGRQ